MSAQECAFPNHLTVEEGVLPTSDQIPLFPELNTRTDTVATSLTSAIDADVLAAIPPAKTGGGVGCARDDAQIPRQALNNAKPQTGGDERKAVAERKKSKNSRLPAAPSEEHVCYLTVHDVAKRLAISVPTVWRWTRDREDFPKPRKLGAGVTRWRLAELVVFERLFD